MSFRYLTRLAVACSVVLFLIHVATAPFRYDGVSAASLGYARSAFELIFLSFFNLAVWQTPPRQAPTRYAMHGANITFLLFSLTYAVHDHGFPAFLVPVVTAALAISGAGLELELRRSRWSAGASTL